MQLFEMFTMWLCFREMTSSLLFLSPQVILCYASQGYNYAFESIGYLLTNVWCNWVFTIQYFNWVMAKLFEAILLNLIQIKLKLQ